jgi:TonB family protein
MIERILLLVLMVWACPASAQFPMLQPPKAKYPQCKKALREAREALDLGEADRSIALCTACIDSKHEPWAHYVRARARLFLKDSMGYCRDMLDTWGLPDGLAVEFRALCTTKDSGDIARMNLEPARYPGIVNVTRQLLRTDSIQRFALYDQRDTLMAAFHVEDGDTIYTKPQEPAEYGEKNKLLYPWMQAEIEYPDSALWAKVRGTVYVRFIVDEHGQVRDPKILRSPAAILSKEVLRAMALMLTWIPARAFGRPVQSLYRLPVQFKLK